MDSPLAAELAHLFRVASTNLLEWQIYAREKADRLALAEPLEYGELPLLLSNAVKATKHGPPRPTILRASGRPLKSTGDK